MLGPTSLSRLEDIKSVIKCLLISVNSRDITLTALNKMYKEQEDEDIPYKDFSYTTLRDFLNDMKDILDLKFNEQKKQLCAYHIPSEKSKHISVLVSKEKQKSDRKSKVRRCNPADPHMLYDVLQKSAKEARNRGSRRVKKNHVLSVLTSYMGRYAFYDVYNLNSQLNEFTHLLTHDDDYIYFKNQLPQVKEAKEKIHLSDLIKNSTQTRLKNLIKKYPKGIWCSELPKLYQQEYKFELEYFDIGFTSIVEFVSALPNIFTLVTPQNTQKQLVVDASISIDLKNTLVKNMKNHTKTLEENTDEVAAIPDKLSPEATKRMFPKNAMCFDDTIETIDAIAFSEKCVDVIVSEVKNPSCFWITLRKNATLFNRLMKQLQDFYTQVSLSKYTIPFLLLEPGLHVAIEYFDIWHRGMVKEKRKDGKLMIYFYDYGTECAYPAKKLYFLDKRFSKIPIQAISCQLDNIKPVGRTDWSSEIRSLFCDRICNKPFVAEVLKVHSMNNSLAVNLIDISNVSDDKYINQWMISNGLAVEGKIICRNNSPHLKYNNKQAEHNTSKSDSPTENQSTSSLSQKYLTFKKTLLKLETLSSSSSASSNVYSSNSSMNCEYDSNHNHCIASKVTLDNQKLSEAESCSSTNLSSSLDLLSSSSDSVCNRITEEVRLSRIIFKHGSRKTIDLALNNPKTTNEIIIPQVSENIKELEKDFNETDLDDNQFNRKPPTHENKNQTNYCSSLSSSSVGNKSTKSMSFDKVMFKDSSDSSSDRIINSHENYSKTRKNSKKFLTDDFNVTLKELQHLMVSAK